MHRQPTSRARDAHTATLGRAVRELRARRVLSQEELGYRARLHRNYVGAIERGEINPTFRTLMTLARGLDVELSALIVLYERRRGVSREAAAPRSGGAAARDDELDPLRSSCR